MKANKNKKSVSFYDLIGNNKGATSVLIIMLLVVLMIFGLTILTTTLSNESLSNKKNEWLTDYYALESKVALSLADMDDSIQVIKEEAVLQSYTPDLNGFMIKQLEENLEGFMEEDGKYYFWVDVAEESGEYLKYITVKAEIIIPNQDSSVEEFLELENYRIVVYSESQDLFEYDDIEFGNPFVPNN